MYSCENPDDTGAIRQMNSELQHAQLELLSAHCATHQLRLHYSLDHLARFGRREVLRKSAEAASALNEFYAAIEKKIPAVAPASGDAPQLTGEQFVQAVECVSSYLQSQREHYLRSAASLSNHHKASVWPYFSSALLDRIAIVELHGERVPTPPFYAQARSLGFDNLPELTHMDSLTFLDVVVFNEKLTERSLFHALVHAVQFQILGVERYAELFVRSFLKTRAHFTVPLEVHAFSLESKFARAAPERFCVEDHVRRWVEQNRY